MLLANLLANDKTEISLRNVGNYIPDLHNKPQVEFIRTPNSMFWQLPYQFVKTHDPYLPFYRDKRVIYIVRDGRAVINSYFYYINAQRQQPLSVRELIDWNKAVPMGTWSEHVLNWAAKPCAQKIILEYENLLTDTLGEMRRVLSWLAWDVDETHLRHAVEASSFDNLRGLEEKHGWFNETRTEQGKSVPFFRQGKNDDWENTLSKEDLAYFWQQHERAMRAFGYS